MASDVKVVATDPVPSKTIDDAASEQHIANSGVLYRLRTFRSSPLQVRKTRENVAASSGKSSAAAPALEKILAGGVLKFREPAQDSLLDQATSNFHIPSDMSAQKKENQHQIKKAETSSVNFGYSQTDVGRNDWKSDSRLITPLSARAIGRGMMNITPVMYLAKPREISRSGVQASIPAVRNSDTALHISDGVLCSTSRPQSQTSKVDGLRSRVVSQIKTKLRKSSKRADSGTRIDGEMLGDTQTRHLSAHYRSRSRTSDWVATSAVISSCRSVVASGDYSGHVDGPLAEGRLSLDSAMLRAVSFPSDVMLSRSAAGSRLSSVFTTDARTTARTSLIESPVRPRTSVRAQGSNTESNPSYSFHAALSITCDSDNIHFASSKQDVWVAVEIRGEVLVNGNMVLQHAGLAKPSLAVALVIDNSLAASPLYKERACAMALLTTNQLRCRGDQLALYTTVPTYSHGQERDYESVPLTAPDLTAIRQNLAKLLRSASSTQTAPKLADAVTQAVDALRRLDFAREHDVRAAQRIVILMTPHSVNVKKLLPVDVLDKIHLHHICPGIIPQLTGAGNILSWRLNDTSRMGVHDIASEEDLQQKSITTLLDCERFKAGLGNIKDVVIDLQPGPESLITEIRGLQYLETLLPGQTSTLLVKMNVDSLQEVGTSKEGKYQASVNGFTISRAFDELEKVLNALSRDLLTVRVSYSHSQFPVNTSLVAKEACWIRRPAQAPRRSDSSNLSGSSMRNKIATHSSAAAQIAGQSNARHALVQLIANAKHLKYADATLLTLLHEELCYQKEITVELELAARARVAVMPSSLSYRQSMSSIVSVQALQEPSLADAKRCSIQKLDARGRDRLFKNSFDSYAMQSRRAEHLDLAYNHSLAVRNADFAANDGSDADSALRVWRQMRQVSKSRPASNPAQDDRDSMADDYFHETLRAYKSQALRNRRSIGNDTLRSMARSLLSQDESSDDVRFD